MKIRTSVMILGVAVACGSAAHAQDYNYVPGWANTTNHAYKGQKTGGEWKAKTELFATLGAQGPEAKCTLQNLSDSDGNVITNQYRSEARKMGEQAALKSAQRKVAAHHRLMKSKGRC